ncbi:unnamed protein product, partial [Prunus brigantina]
PITFCSYGAVDANEIMVDAKRDDYSCPDQITLIKSLLFRVRCMIPSKPTHFRNGNGNRKVHGPCIREEGSFICLSFWLQLEGVPSSRYRLAARCPNFPSQTLSLNRAVSSLSLRHNTRPIFFFNP